MVTSWVGSCWFGTVWVGRWLRWYYWLRYSLDATITGWNGHLLRKSLVELILIQMSLVEAILIDLIWILQWDIDKTCWFQRLGDLLGIRYAGLLGIAEMTSSRTSHYFMKLVRGILLIWSVNASCGLWEHSTLPGHRFYFQRCFWKTTLSRVD